MLWCQVAARSKAEETIQLDSELAAGSALPAEAAARAGDTRTILRGLRKEEWEAARVRVLPLAPPGVLEHGCEGGSDSWNGRGQRGSGWHWKFIIGR